MKCLFDLVSGQDPTNSSSDLKHIESMKPLFKRCSMIFLVSESVSAQFKQWLTRCVDVWVWTLFFHSSHYYFFVFSHEHWVQLFECPSRRDCLKKCAVVTIFTIHHISPFFVTAGFLAHFEVWLFRTGRSTLAFRFGQTARCVPWFILGHTEVLKGSKG